MNAQEGTILHHKNPVIQSNIEGWKNNFLYVTHLVWNHSSAKIINE